MHKKYIDGIHCYRYHEARRIAREKKTRRLHLWNEYGKPALIAVAVTPFLWAFGVLAVIVLG